MHTVPEESKVPGGGGDDWQQFSLSGANESQHEGDKQPAPVEGGSAVSTVVAARMPAALQAAEQDMKWASLTAADAEQQSTTTRVVRVSAHHIGTYAFKGCGAMDMVCLTSDAIIGMAAPQAVAPPTGSKGMYAGSCSFTATSPLQEHNKPAHNQCQHIGKLLSMPSVFNHKLACLSCC